MNCFLFFFYNSRIIRNEWKIINETILLTSIAVEFYPLVHCKVYLSLSLTLIDNEDNKTEKKISKMENHEKFNKQKSEKNLLIDLSNETKPKDKSWVSFHD